MFINQYLLLLGEFDLDNIDGSNKLFAWILFFLATFLSQVLIFNMLIAIMGDTYAKVSEMKNQAALKEKINILCDYLRVVKDTEERDSYLVVLTPDEADEDGWDGVLNAVKKNLDKSFLKISNLFNKKFTVVNQDISSLKAQNINLGYKLGDIQNIIQKNEVNVNYELAFIRYKID